MGETPEARRRVAPRDRLAVEGYLFVGEAVDFLAIKADYRQMRRMHALVREQSAGEPPEGSWARYTLVDLACIQAIIDALGGPDVFEERRRLHLEPVRETCLWLGELGFENPLLQVPMRVEGRNAVVLLNEIAVQPQTGQLLLEATFERLKTSVGGSGLLAAAHAELRQSSTGNRAPVPAQVRGRPDDRRDLLSG